MRIPEYIEDKINKLPKRHVFTYVDFMSEVNRREAVIKYLNRLVASGKICKLSKEKYFKPQEIGFGSLLPDQREIIKNLLEENRNLVGYVTGYGLYNLLGLTAKVSSVIQISKREIIP